MLVACPRLPSRKRKREIRPLRLSASRAPRQKARLPGQPGPQWGVEIASSFEKQQSLDAFGTAKDTYSDVLGDYSPTIVEVCDLSMGTDLRYSARIDFDDRDAADKLCNKLQAAGGACVVLKN